MSTTEWANEYRWMAPEQSAKPGKYKTRLTPWVPGMLDALDDPTIRKVVCQKSAQVAWTDGVWNNYLGKRIHLDPCGVVLLFPKEKTIRKYLDQKFVPTVRATPVLRELVDVSTSRSTGNRMDYKQFPGGFLACVASNAPDNVKSLSAPVVAVEEPDDCSDDVRGQGDSVLLLEERAKSYENRKIIFGGTPTVDGHSRVQDAYRKSDRRKFWVPCHECGKSHVLDWDNVNWKDDPSRCDEVLGPALPKTARYACAECGCLWDDRQKNLNVRQGEWIAERETGEVAGFYINELYSPFDGSKFANLVTKYLSAKHALEQGDESAMIAFVNNTLGLAYAYKSDAPGADLLRDRAEAYPELQVTARGLVLTMGVDVQPDRLAVVITAWGRGEESWTLYWGEIYARTAVTDVHDPVWDELDRILFGSYRHERGFSLQIRAADIDAGDGNTSDAVYSYVRTRRNRGVKLRAIKGSNNIDAEIVTTPKKIDLTSTSKASRFGLEIWLVGVNKAKDLIVARMKLTGTGSGRMHWYSEIRSDYYDQMTGEAKIPSRKQRGKMVWTKKSGARVEAWDCTVYALHAARAERLHVKPPTWWDALEAELMQGDLLSGDPAAVIEAIADQPAPEFEAAANTGPKDAGVVVKTGTFQKPLSMADLGRMMGSD
tara:strand:- start:22438 stop:24408 length:1971 start_codon:yes stop_codon:yes gene_type:complete